MDGQTKNGSIEPYKMINKHFTDSDVIEIGNRLFKPLTGYAVSGYLSTTAYLADAEVCPVFLADESSRKNRNQSATVK